jgi:DNA-binding response OmpR family regulator
LKTQLRLYATDFSVIDDEDDKSVFDMVIIDNISKKINDIQKKMCKTPIVYLSSDDSNNFPDSVHVIAKPIKLENFLDTVHASVNIFSNSSNGIISFNKFELNSGNKEIKNLRNEEITKLTEREVSILKYLYKVQKKIVSKSELLSEVWGYNPNVTTHTVETHIYRLRQKVEHDNKEFQIIITEDNGYKLKS